MLEAWLLRVGADTPPSDIVPTFYDRSADGLPRRWIANMKSSIGALSYSFNTQVRSPMPPPFRCNPQAGLRKASTRSRRQRFLAGAAEGSATQCGFCRFTGTSRSPFFQGSSGGRRTRLR